MFRDETFCSREEESKAVVEYVFASPDDGGEPDASVVVPYASLLLPSQVFVGIFAEVHIEFHEYQPSIDR